MLTRHGTACFCVLAWLALFAPVAGAVEVTIVSWNILTYDNPGSSEYEALVRIVEALDPDILLVQEANNASGRSAFMSHFAPRYPYSFLGSPTNGHPRNQILSAYALSNTFQIFTADPNGGSFERPTVRADVDVLPLEPGTELRVYSVHYKSGSTSRDKTLRLNQATDDSNDIVALITVDPDARVYYAGDLNSDLGDPPLNKLLEPQTTLSRLSIANPHTGSQMTRWPSGTRIDHVFYSATLSGDFLDQYIFDSYTIPSGLLPPPVEQNDSRTASDHLALVTTIEIAEEPPPPEDFLINEAYVRHQTAQWETREFIEVFGPPGTSLAGLSIVIVEGDAESNPGKVDRVWPLDGQEVPPNGFFVAGDADVNPDFQTGSFNTLENGTQTILLIRNTTLANGQDVDPDDDGVADVTNVGTIEDSMALADGGIGGSDHTYYEAPVVGPAGPDVPPGAARVPDAFDTDTGGDFVQLSFLPDGGDGEKASSPGLSNFPGDFDRDGNVDQDDVGVLRAAMSGANNPTSDARTDLDDDGDTDQTDFGILQAHLTGPGPESVRFRGSRGP